MSEPSNRNPPGNEVAGEVALYKNLVTDEDIGRDNCNALLRAVLSCWTDKELHV